MLSKKVSRSNSDVGASNGQTEEDESPWTSSHARHDSTSSISSPLPIPKTGGAGSAWNPHDDGPDSELAFGADHPVVDSHSLSSQEYYFVSPPVYEHIMKDLSDARRRSPFEALERSSSSRVFADYSGSLPQSSGLPPDPSPVLTDNRSVSQKKTSVAKAPVASRVPYIVAQIHGDSIYDDFYWFREKSNPRVMEYLEAENTFADLQMKHTEDLQNTLYNEFVERMLASDAEVPLRIDNYFYYKRVETDKEYAMHCRKYDSLDNTEEVIFDENEWAEGEDYFEVGAFEVSPNHNLAAISTDTTGNERYTCYFKDLTSGKVLDDEIPNMNAIRWANDNQNVFYTVLHPDTLRSYRLYRHKLGTRITEDELVYQEDDEAFVLSISRTTSGRYFLLRLADQATTEIHYLDADDPEGQFKVLYPRQSGVEYYAEHHGNKFFILTNDDGAVNFKIVQVPVLVPAKRNWREVLPHSEAVMLQNLLVFKHHLVVWALCNTFGSIKILDLSDGEWHAVEFNDPLYSVWPGNNPDEEGRLICSYRTNKLRFTKTSFVDPIAYYDYDMDNRTRTKRKIDTVLGGYVPSLYYQERVFATAPDGAKIPISVVFRKDMRNVESGNFMLLVGYGAYGGNQHPKFDPYRLSLLDRGFIYAIAHVRGSAICGRRWYMNGKLLHKKNTFTDFIACAEHLIEHRYTTPDKLAIYGRSAGGLLIGSVVNMAPHLFKVAVTEVPFVDVINTMLDPKIPWVAFEFSEWGDPRDEEYYRYMKSYSPYDNVKPQNYPHMLITSGFNDPRVPYWEPTKLVAKLRSKKTDSNTLILRTQIAGHMGSTGRYYHLEDLAYTYGFIIDKLDVAPHMTVAKPLMKVVPPTQLAPPDLLRMFQGFQITMILNSALELGIFDTLALQDKPCSAEDIANLISCSDRGTRILLDALVAMGLLEKDGSEYLLSLVAHTHLVKGLPNYIGDVRHFTVNPYLWDAMRRLPDAVRNGGPLVGPYAQDETGSSAVEHMQTHWENIARYNTVATSSVGQQVATLLAPWAVRHKPLHVLDVGCGAGFLGFSLVQKHPHARLWSLDWPNVVSVARQYAEQLELGERVTFLEGDFFMTPLGGPYDLIIIDQILHRFSEDQCAMFLRRILDVLKPNGRVVIYETIAGIDDSNPHPQLFSVSMLVQSQCGEAYSLSWHQRLLSDAGFAPPSVHNLQGSADKILITSSNLIPLRKKKETPRYNR